MVNLERNESDFIKSTVRNMIQNCRVGHVVQVYEHVEDDDNSNFEVDVNFPGEEDLEHRVAPLQNPGMDSIDVPRVGDKVMVEYLHGDKKNPVVRNTVDTNEDRAVKGTAGMWRRRFRSGDSAAGTGDLYLTGTTVYDQNPAVVDYRDLTEQQAYLRIAKKEDALDEPDADLPMLIEMFDDPANDDARIAFETNQSDAPFESMQAELDVKNGVITLGGDAPNKDIQIELDLRNNTAKVSGLGTNEMGFSMDFDTNAIKMVDGEGYGVESDGAGNFTWHHETIDFSEGTTTSL